mmetsp:Transcript_20606/g.66800  ORF Transcript_20606/g.66800 Transcript_20606/m.66800 type:complete len:208 (-) Transcript_20606:142-765(-)
MFDGGHQREYYGRPWPRGRPLAIRSGTFGFTPAFCRRRPQSHQCAEGVSLGGMPHLLQDPEQSAQTGAEGLHTQQITCNKASATCCRQLSRISSGTTKAGNGCSTDWTANLKASILCCTLSVTVIVTPLAAVVGSGPCVPKGCQLRPGTASAAGASSGEETFWEERRIETTDFVICAACLKEREGLLLDLPTSASAASTGASSKSPS